MYLFACRIKFKIKEYFSIFNLPIVCKNNLSQNDPQIAKLKKLKEMKKFLWWVLRILSSSQDLKPKVS
jgi:hypothetical protein